MIIYVQIILNRKSQPSRYVKCPQNKGDKIIGSMDVAALFPSCKADKSSQRLDEALNKCNLEFQNIDRDFLCK